MNHQKTINQLLDRIDSLTIDQLNANPKLGEIRQKLIDKKRAAINGGLLKVRSTNEILCIIEFAKTQSETATIKHYAQKAVLRTQLAES